MLMKTARSNLVVGLLPRTLEGGVLSLQHANDTLLFLENDLEKVNNLKWLLICYKKMTSMKIKYDKNDLLTIGIEE